MKKLAFGALFTGLLSVVAACGGGDSAPDAPDICVGAECVDGGTTPDAGQVCNPVAQTGCEAGQKCTWITIVEPSAADRDGVGVIGCVQDGTAGIGEACTDGPAGEGTGFDTCAAGGYCIAGTCQEICTDVPDSCDAETSACGRYTGVFNETTPVIGVCDFKCDPVDQTRVFDDAENCGGTVSGTPPSSNRGCYGYTGGTQNIDFTCAPAFPDNAMNTHYVTLAADDAFLNACAPGYGLLPFSYEPAPDLAVCVAYCRPGPSSMGQTTNLNGLSGSGFTCATRGGTLPETECRYWQWLEATWQHELSPEKADFGFCLKFGDHRYDSDQDGTFESPFPSCGTLSATDGPDDDTFPDAEGWGCMPQITAASAQGASFRQMLANRLGVKDAPATSLQFAK